MISLLILCCILLHFQIRIHMLHKMFHCGSVAQLKMEGSLICTADNPSTNKPRSVSALGCLAELLKTMITNGDYLVLFGAECWILGKHISLNSPLQDAMLIGHYRPDMSSGWFDFPFFYSFYYEILKICKNSKYLISNTPKMMNKNKKASMKSLKCQK
jgi:hypothetical protein